MSKVSRLLPYIRTDEQSNFGLVNGFCSNLLVKLGNHAFRRSLRTAFTLASAVLSLLRGRDVAVQ